MTLSNDVKEQQVNTTEKKALFPRAIVFLLFSIFVWFGVVFLLFIDDFTRTLLLTTAVVATISQTSCFVLSAYCRKTKKMGYEEYLLSIPLRTGIVLVCVLVSLALCEESYRLMYALRVAIGYFITFPVLLVLTFPSEERACELALQANPQREEGKTISRRIDSN